MYFYFISYIHRRDGTTYHGNMELAQDTPWHAGMTSIVQDIIEEETGLRDIIILNIVQIQGPQDDQAQRFDSTPH